MLAKKSTHLGSTHLWPALAALVIIIGLVLGAGVYVHALESRYLRALGPLRIDQSDVGSALQRLAFEQPDLLTVYGGSELRLENSPNQALQFFRDYPAGFNVYLVEMDGAGSLTMAQNLAAIGASLRGKKVVISFTPTMLLIQQADPVYYAGHFSDLHANALVFNPQLSYSVKARAARRMLLYADTLDENDALLRFGLHNLADNSVLNRASYYASLPLGLLHIYVLRLQDHWEVLRYIWGHPQISPQVERRQASIDWPAEIAQARLAQIANTNTNPYGLLNSVWLAGDKNRIPPGLPVGTQDKSFLHDLSASREWSDLDVLLGVLKELGAQPLILSRPFNGAIWDANGVSRAARQAYYDKLKALVNKYSYPLVEFEPYDSVTLFTIDRSSHTSRLGWVYVNQVLDAFYHGSPLPYQ